MTDFPTIVYRVPGPFKKPRGGTYATRGAANKEEYTELLKKGWYPSYEAAIAKDKADQVIEVAETFEDAIDEVSAPTRKELEIKAKQLKVSFNSRTSDKKLAERIAEALEG